MLLLLYKPKQLWKSLIKFQRGAWNSVNSPMHCFLHLTKYTRTKLIFHHAGLMFSTTNGSKPNPIICMQDIQHVVSTIPTYGNFITSECTAMTTFLIVCKYIVVICIVGTKCTKQLLCWQEYFSGMVVGSDDILIQSAVSAVQLETWKSQ